MAERERSFQYIVGTRTYYLWREQAGTLQGSGPGGI